MPGTAKAARGFTLLELLIAMALAGFVLAAMSSVVNNALRTDEVVAERNRLLRDARFAMDRMVRAVSQTRLMLLPMPDKPDTDWRENVREETIPASPPEGSSTLATAVLAVSLSASVDLDADGFPDADNDRDGRLDEDYPGDVANDSNAGLHLIDDGGDGLVDEGTGDDDDEQLSAADEDPIDGVDNDVDGIVDEDPGADMNGDGAPGVAGVDDDGDGQIDEGAAGDDDEDGSVDEDWLDAVVFYLQGATLVERHPVPWDEEGGGGITGRDFLVSEIADNVTRFSVERVATQLGAPQLVGIVLELTGPGGDVVSLEAQARVGGSL